MHLLLNGTGICYRALTFCRDKYLVLLYRPAQLKTYLKQPEVKTFLADYGYEENSLEKVLERLSLRVREHSKNEIEFPHEIGIFLNYPLEDVRGFIEHKGQDSLFCGYWKVYHDPEKAKLTRMAGNLKTQIGQPDLIILFTSTVAHKMVHCALKEAERYNIRVERTHSASANALENVLVECCG